MSSTLEYFPPPSGPLSTLTRSVAMLRLEPEHLESRAGLRFRAAHDDLDLLDWAEVVGISGRRYALVRHRRSPQTGTEIVTSQDSSDPRSDIRDVLRGLNLTDDDVLWTASDVARTGDKATKAATGKGDESPRKLVRFSAQVKIRLPLTEAALNKLRRPVRGRGGFQSLLRKLQKQVRGTELEVSLEDFDKLVRYSVAYGAGGLQERTHAAVNTSKRAAKKR